jgi:NAD(P)H-hydrate repair Nnr-like enzyme with NAD(P)H-hydrate dehydratase domain
MLGVSVDEVQEQRLSLAREFASKHGVVLVLKSADTIISTPEGACFINSNGSPALAKSGSGDCLTGLITGLIAQGYELEEAAVLGCYILGEASHKATEEISERSVKTTDIINSVGMVLSELEV